jgi:general secretion pathway protein B
MSFILDALKKSENERQRTVGPSLADAPVRVTENNRPWWAVAVAGLLVGNLAVLLFVLLRDKTPESTAPAAAPAVASPVPVQSHPARPLASRPSQLITPSADPSVRSLAEEAGVAADAYDDTGYADTEGMDPGESPQAAQTMRSIDPPAVAPLSARQSADSGRSGEVLPNASSLIASGTSLPDMRLDIHVYSNNPGERFVFINMRKYAEGQATTEGPTVERITPDGAVLNNQGLRFVLPRQ